MVACHRDERDLGICQALRPGPEVAVSLEEVVLVVEHVTGQHHGGHVFRQSQFDEPVPRRGRAELTPGGLQVRGQTARLPTKVEIGRAQ